MRDFSGNSSSFCAFCGLESDSSALDTLRAMSAFRPVSAPRIVRDFSIALTAAAVVAFGFWRQRLSESGRAPARIAGKPNFNGIWQALNTANYELLPHQAKAALAFRPGPVVPVPAHRSSRLAPLVRCRRAMACRGRGDSISPEAAKKQKENQANWLDRDPEIKCYLPGVPRANYMRTLPDPAERQGDLFCV
jgi:hypothetical protein